MSRSGEGRANHNAFDRQFEQPYLFVAKKITIALNDPAVKT